jgi:hypothetical protein
VTRPSHPGWATGRPTVLPGPASVAPTGAGASGPPPTSTIPRRGARPGLPRVPPGPPGAPTCRAAAAGRCPPAAADGRHRGWTGGFRRARGVTPRG